MGATLREVARAAGVSTATVSRSFNRPEKVDPATLQRIQEVVQRLSYVPNRAAQALITGRTGMLGLIVPDLNNPFFTGIVKGAQSAVREAGSSLLISDTDEDPTIEFGLVQGLAQRTDAIVLCSSRMSEEELQQASALTPTVLVNRTHPSMPAISFDSAVGVRAAALHLRALGHHRVGYIAGPAHSVSNADRVARISQEFPDKGLEVVDLGHHEPSLAGGRASADRVLSAGVTAVMVYNDVMALGLLNRLAEYGVAVPTDMSIIGWDDIEFAEMVTPGLTTVHVPRITAGRAAIDYLMAHLDGREPVLPWLPTELVFRGTTARAPSAETTSAATVPPPEEDPPTR